MVFEALNIINMSKAPEPKSNPDKKGAYLPNGASAKAGLNKSLLDAGSRTIPAVLRRQG
jgi:putative transposase